MKLAKLTPLLLIGVSLAGCSTVEPWERGTLAKPQMAVDPTPLQTSYRSHIYESREAASGRNAAQGGGCGCN
jgi:Domain of unknown function (DUF4266)